MAKNKKKMRLESLEERRVLTTFIVTNVSDAGEGSLRQAILDSNASLNEEDGADRIEFAIESGQQVIQPATPYPKITDTVVIDGTSQNGFDGSPLIEIDGSLMTENTGNEIGLEVDWNVSGAQIRGLVINSFLVDQVRVRGTNTIIAGNFLGLESDGLTATGGGRGILLTGDSNVVGGPTEVDRNIVSGNSNGVWITGDQNIIVGNFIGTDVSGLVGVGNERTGIVNALSAEGTIIGGEDDGAANVVSGNGRSGIELSSNAIAQQNLIGTGVDGSTEIGNRISGIEVNGGEGAQIEGNAIAHTLAGAGVRVASSSSGVSVLGNSIYANVVPLDLGADGNTSNDSGDADQGDNGLQNYPELSFVQLGGDSPSGVEVTYRVDSLPANSAYPLRVEFYAVETDGPNPHSTFLGFDEYTEENASADNKLTTLDNVVLGSRESIVATATDAMGNTSEFSPAQLFAPVAEVEFVVTSTADSGPGSLRQAIVDANENSGLDKISFNISGDDRRIQPTSVLPTITDPLVIDARTQPGFDGTPVVELNGELLDEAVEQVGLEITWGVNGSGILGLAINQFATDAIRIRGNETIVAGNYLGTDLAGTSALQNGRGVLVIGDNNVVGGRTVEDRNLISGNHTGVWVIGKDNAILGNFVGTDASGNLPLANTSSGIVSRGTADGVRIGGAGIGEGNVIGANDRFGIEIASAGVIQQNSIGVGVDGTSALGNRFAGIAVGSDAGDVQGISIGGLSTDEGNTIANSPRGVWVLSNSNGVTEGVSIQGNSIFASTTPIQLGSTGFVANDPGDADTGPNRLQNHPVVISAEQSGAGVDLRYRVSTNPDQTPDDTYPIRVEFFVVDATSARRVAVDELVAADFASPEPAKHFIENFTLQDDQLLVATATDAAGNTSAYSLGDEDAGQPTDPEPTDPEPTDPEPTDPEPTDPEPTDPEPTDPEPTDPEPTDPEPTDPTDPEVLADFNENGAVDVEDIDILFRAIAAGASDVQFDLNADGSVDQGDVDYLIGPTLKTLPGDANLDGVVDFGDFLILSTNFGDLVNSWGDADFDGNGKIEFADFLILSRRFNKMYEEPEVSDPGPTDPEPTDPEPTDPEPTDPEPTDPEPTDPEPTEPVDETEPNEVSTQAFEITDSTELTGLRIDPAEDIDWFRWSSSTTGELTIQLTTSVDRTDVAVRLFAGNPDSALAVTELTPGTITIEVEQDLTYLLQVRGVAEVFDYDLKLSLE